jgi:hypothetical protein
MSLSSVFKAKDNDFVSKDTPFLKNTKGSIMIVSGKKRTGKSSLVLSMLESNKIFKGYFGNIWLISPSKEEKTKVLREELDKEGKYFTELNEPNIKSVTDFIKNEMNVKKMKEKKLNKKLPEIYNLLILDDCVADLPRSMKKNVITNLFYNCRHFNLQIFCLTQSYKNIAPNLRKQTDLLYIFPMSNKKEKEAIQEDWDIPDEVFEECFEDESDHPFLTVNLVGTKPTFFRKMDKMEI